MQVQLRDSKLARFIDEQVKAGHFQSADDAVEAAVARMMLNDHRLDLDEETLAAIDESEDQIARGESMDWQQVSAELRKRYLSK